MKFFLSVAHGRSFTVSDGVETLTLPPSFSTDLSGLGEAVVLLLQGVSTATWNWPVGSWYIPPGDYRWLLTRDDDDLRLRILWFPEPFSRKPDEHGELVFSAVCPLRRFAVQVKNGLDALSAMPHNEGWAASVRQKLNDALKAAR